MDASHTLRIRDDYAANGYYQVNVHFLPCEEVDRFDYWSHDAQGHRSSAAWTIHSLIDLKTGETVNKNAAIAMLVAKYGLQFSKGF